MIQRAAAAMAPSASPSFSASRAPALTTSMSTSSLVHTSAFPLHAAAGAILALSGKEVPGGTAI
ncbi:hypothetical protein HJA_16350 [Hyphomonas jannaschiana VP2]|uniref:Uncharacterized protein n=1 Tax=Hyphomonas jannaschiana VP2 TaxID=1280952 RepID=A0A059F6T2_9PROT|nr:hypothetical protein HJA_16350 [Hyphomonas jannaschiana VP2]